MTAPWQIRRLAAADLPQYRRVRLAGLAAHPEAFGSAWEDESQHDDAAFALRMLPTPPSLALGGFAGDALVGMVGLTVKPGRMQRHKGMVYGVYVAPDQRGTGLARGLLIALIEEASRSGLLLLQLTVAVGNDRARRLYASLGFQTYGIERRALRIGDIFVDDELMALDLA